MLDKETLNRKIVAVDGLASTGKTSLSHALAEKLGFLHFSTGILYRAVGLAARRSKLFSEQGVPDEHAVSALIRSDRFSLSLADDGIGVQVCFDGHLLGEEIFSAQSGADASLVAKLPLVRQALYSLQRHAFPGKDMVVEGRDIGTVIFPDAHIKFYITVDEEVAAQRRRKQLLASGAQASEVEKLREQLATRNANDSQRAVAPTQAAADAHLIDNSQDGMGKALEAMLGIYQAHPEF